MKALMSGVLLVAGAVVIAVVVHEAPSIVRYLKLEGM
jgi:hypothetical protein